MASFVNCNKDGDPPRILCVENILTFEPHPVGTLIRMNCFDTKGKAEMPYKIVADIAFGEFVKRLRDPSQIFITRTT